MDHNFALRNVFCLIFVLSESSIHVLSKNGVFHGVFMTTNLRYPGLTSLHPPKSVKFGEIHCFSVQNQLRNHPMKCCVFVARETSKPQIIVLEQFWGSFGKEKRIWKCKISILSQAVSLKRVCPLKGEIILSSGGKPPGPQALPRVYGLRRNTSQWKSVSRKN